MASIKRRGGLIRIELRPEERMVLAGFAREVAQLVGGGADDGPEHGADAGADPLAELVGLHEAPDYPSDDPALQRLFPDAYDDPAAAQEFRRLTSGELRRTKATALADLAAAIEAHGGRVEVEPEQADMWLAAVNDIRLVLATRLGVDDDAGTWRTQMPPDDPRLPLVAAYDWLSMLQELLVDALT